ncbi:MAG: hypothetical protein Q9178_006196 [Gyalolechia marmorata]
MKNISLYCRALRNRLNAQVQQLVASVIESLQALTESSRCSCEQLGNCRIVLVTVINDDETTYLEPSFRDCNCSPVWHDFHQRQLHLINTDLADRQVQRAQLTALEEGVRGLLLRHRELAKAEVRQEQYWLRQDYARTDEVRRLQNVHIRNECRKRSTSDDSSAILDKGVEWPVDAEDLYIDEDVYEFRPCVSEQPTSLSKALSDSQTDTEKETSPEIKTTLNTIRRDHGQFLSLDEVLSRFEDFKKRAAALMDEWEDEDATRGSKIDAVYPWANHQRSCACTAEQKLYHRYQNFGSTAAYADLEAAMFRSDRGMEEQRISTADKGVEIERMLRLFDDHVSSQIVDLEAAQGGDGRRKAFVRYLRRYDWQLDLQVDIRGDSYASGARTSELLRETDTMLERWADRKGIKGGGFADMEW